MCIVSQVTIAGLLGKNAVRCSRQVMIMPDKALFEVADNKFDVVILPGGLQGANSLAVVSLLYFINSQFHVTLLEFKLGILFLIVFICA